MFLEKNISLSIQFKSTSYHRCNHSRFIEISRVLIFDTNRITNLEILYSLHRFVLWVRLISSCCGGCSRMCAPSFISRNITRRIRIIFISTSWFFGNSSGWFLWDWQWCISRTTKLSPSPLSNPSLMVTSRSCFSNKLCRFTLHSPHPKTLGNLVHPLLIPTQSHLAHTFHSRDMLKINSLAFRHFSCRANVLFAHMDHARPTLTDTDPLAKSFSAPIFLTKFFHILPHVLRDGRL